MKTKTSTKKEKKREKMGRPATANKQRPMRATYLSDEEVEFCLAHADPGTLTLSAFLRTAALAFATNRKRQREMEAQAMGGESGKSK